MADLRIDQLPTNATPSSQTLLEVYDPTKTPKSGSSLLTVLLIKALQLLTGTVGMVLTRDSDGTPYWASQQIITLTNRAELKAYPSDPHLQLVFILDPEPGVRRCYRAMYNDPSLGDDISIISATDGLANYFEFPLL